MKSYTCQACIEWNGGPPANTTSPGPSATPAKRKSQSVDADGTPTGRTRRGSKYLKFDAGHGVVERVVAQEADDDGGGGEGAARAAT